MMNRDPRGGWGLSLLEVIVAASILTGAIFTLGILIPRSVLHLHNKGFEATAAQLAEQVFDETRGLDAADIPNGSWDGRFEVGGVPHPAATPVHGDTPRRRFPPTPYPAAAASPCSMTVDMNGQSVTVDYGFVVDLEPGGAAGTRIMTVTVYWKEPQGNGAVIDKTWKMVSQIGP